MSTTTKKTNNPVMEVGKVVFGTNNEDYETDGELLEDHETDVELLLEDYDLDVELLEVLRKTLSHLKKNENVVEQALVSDKQSSNKAGFVNKINPETKAAMRQIYNKIIKDNEGIKENDNEENSRDERNI